MCCYGTQDPSTDVTLFLYPESYLSAGYPIGSVYVMQAVTWTPKVELKQEIHWTEEDSGMEHYGTIALEK